MSIQYSSNNLNNPELYQQYQKSIQTEKNSKNQSPSSKLNNGNSYISNINNKNSYNQKLWKQNETTLHLTSPRLSFLKQKRFQLHSIYWNDMLRNQHDLQMEQMNKSKNKGRSYNSNGKGKKSHIQLIAKKISKQIDQEIKNQMRNKVDLNNGKKQNKMNNSNNSSFIQQPALLKTNRNFSEVNYKKKLSLGNKNIKQEKRKFILNQKNKQIVQRLTASSPKRQSFLRDRHGHRCNLFQEDDNFCLTDGNNLSNINTLSNLTMSSSKGFKISSKRMNLNLPLNYYPGPGKYQIKRYLQDFQIQGKPRPKLMSAR